MEHINWTLGVIVPYINFVTFLIVAIILFRKPAAQAAKKAREVFDKTSNEALQKKIRLQKDFDELKKRFDSLPAEIADMRAVAEASALAEEKALVMEGERLAKHVREETKRVIEAEIEKAKMNIGIEILESVKAQVVERIKSEVDLEKHHRIVKKGISNLSSLEKS